jgi:nicotinate-nucleotide adenylyltransferase
LKYDPEVKVGIFGGTFNPPHNGHLQIAEAAEQQYALDRLLFIPTCIPPHKVQDETGPADRLAMVRLALEDRDRWECNDLEIQRGGTSYTVDTLKALREEHPGAKFFLMIGSDNLLSFHRWRQPEAVAAEASLLVYERPGFPLPSNAGESSIPELHIRVIRGAAVDISSSEIRRRIREKKNVSELVPPKVLSYIQAHGLYQ